METTANGTSPFQCGFGCRAPVGRDGTGLRSRSRGTTAPGADHRVDGKRVVERERRMVPDVSRRSAAGERERRSKVRRQLGGDIDLGLRDRMLEPKAVGMQAL